MDQIKRRITQACVIFVIVLAMLVGLEAAARFAKYAKSQFASSESQSLSIGDALVLKQEWGKQYVADQARLRWRHELYVEFREKPMKSPTINVDENATRVVPGSCQRPNAETFLVLLFGGSTMFGYGAPDQFTVPAYLARALNRPGRCVKLINYGAGWWQSSQSVIQLLKILREGTRPNAVVFYDGINDVNIVIEGNSSGGIAPHAELLLRNAFERPFDDDGDWKRLIRKSVLIRVTARWLFGQGTKSAENTGVIDIADLPRVAKSIAQVYVQNVRTVEALAREYEFNAYFFLQPYPLAADKKKTELESAVFRWEDRAREVELIRGAYDEWRNNPYLKRQRRFYDISRLFDGMTQELYADTEHLLPEGNRLVAERIANEVRLSE